MYINKINSIGNKIGIDILLTSCFVTFRQKTKLLLCTSSSPSSSTPPPTENVWLIITLQLDSNWTINYK